MDSIAFDWDGTLVDEHQEWLEGAKDALRLAGRRHEVFIHSCRANWPAGERQIRSKLDEASFTKVRIHGKPSAIRYVDDRALEFKGDWESLKPHLR